MSYGSTERQRECDGTGHDLVGRHHERDGDDHHPGWRDAGDHQWPSLERTLVNNGTVTEAHTSTWPTGRWSTMPGPGRHGRRLRTRKGGVRPLLSTTAGRLPRPAGPERRHRRSLQQHRRLQFQTGMVSLREGDEHGRIFQRAFRDYASVHSQLHSGCASSLTGAGAVDFNGGTVNVNGAFNVTGTVSVTGATASLNGAVAVAVFNLTGGTFSGSAILPHPS